MNDDLKLNNEGGLETRSFQINQHRNFFYFYCKEWVWIRKEILYSWLVLFRNGEMLR